MHLACVLCGLSMEEALAAATINAAYAVSRETHVGSLEPGKYANLVVLRAPSYAAFGHGRIPFTHYVHNSICINIRAGGPSCL